VNESIAPRATYKNLQDTAVANGGPPCDPRQGETQEFHFSHSKHSTPFSPLSFASPFTHGTSTTTQEIGQPTGADRNPNPAALASDPTIAGSDAGPSRSSSIEAEVDVEVDVADFRDPALPPKVQQAMRLLVCKIRDSAFLANDELEPFLGTFHASSLMADVPSDFWNDYGTKGKSIYSLFIRVDGDNCMCLLCGDVQHGKLLRAIGHFRSKHLRHKPYPCGLIHADEKVW
jgi:hypothetical protein